MFLSMLQNILKLFLGWSCNYFLRKERCLSQNSQKYGLWGINLVCERCVFMFSNLFLAHPSFSVVGIHSHQHSLNLHSEFFCFIKIVECSFNQGYKLCVPKSPQSVSHSPPDSGLQSFLVLLSDKCFGDGTKASTVYFWAAYYRQGILVQVLIVKVSLFELEQK